MTRQAEALDTFVTELAGTGLVSAVVALIGSAEQIEAWAAGGRRGRLQPDPPDLRSLFDLASLTKPFVASLALVLERQGSLPLGLRLGEVWPGAHPAVARSRLEDLLRHRAGFLPWIPLYHRCATVAEAQRLLLSGELLGARRGVYSDLDFLLWGLTAERCMGLSLEELLCLHLLGPLGIREVAVPPVKDAQVVECSLGGGREAELAAAQGLAVEALPPPVAGVPQDGNARFLGRLSGHAGLFAGAVALWRLGSEWLLPRRALDAAAVERALGGRSRLGWMQRRAGGAGEPLGPRAFGHSGFTGGSLWIEPRAGRILVLLAHRTSVGADLDRWRRRFHRLARDLFPTGERGETW